MLGTLSIQIGAALSEKTYARLPFAAGNGALYKRAVRISTRHSTNKKVRASRTFFRDKTRAATPGQPVQSSFARAVLSFAVNDLVHESGRRDWTRTNDPHHVKVVL